jgi:NAD(P)-dependent dehydrogenase (short-subunit alcohol dehydrogenase family)
MFEDLAGRAAVVTGGARGLGFAMAKALARHDVNIGLVDRLPAVSDSADALAEEIGVKAVGVTADVTDPDSVGSAFDAVHAALGPTTILVNSAGIAEWDDAIDQPFAAWRRVLAVNLDGTFLCCQALARRCRDGQRGASIINVASMSGIVVNVPQKQAAYNTSKAAVSMLTKSLAVEWQPLGIRVNAISPGYFLSDMTRQFVEENPELAESWRERIPAGRMGEPEDLDATIVYLASDASRYVVGQTLVIDGGYTLI